MRDRRVVNPSSRLTADSNVAQPALSSHRESVAQVQAQRARAAAEAQKELDVSLSAVNPQLGLAPDDHLTLRPGSVPPITNPPSESGSELDRPSTAAAKTGKKKRTRCKNSGEYLHGKYIPIYLLFSGVGDAAPTDNDGLYQDVAVMEIDSDSSDSEKRNKNKNPKADIDQFFDPVRHMKGDKHGRRQCKTCR